MAETYLPTYWLFLWCASWGEVVPCQVMLFFSTCAVLRTHPGVFCCTVLGDQRVWFKWQCVFATERLSLTGVWFLHTSKGRKERKMLQ